VTVNSILAGPTRSEGAEGFVKSMAEQQGLDAAAFERQFFERARPSSLLKRFETPEEVAALVAFVASEWASAINGAALRVDVGVLRGIFRPISHLRPLQPVTPGKPLASLLRPLHEEGPNGTRCEAVASTAEASASRST
jgi:hypothetical protein